MRATVGVLAVLFVVTGCRDGHADSSVRARAKRAKTRAEAKRKYDPVAFERTLAGIERKRKQLWRRYRSARGEQKRRAIRAEARRYVLTAIDKEIFGPWMGTPWSMGRNSTSLRPHQKGMTVGCSYFVTSVLLNAGLRLSNRYTYAQAPALHIQRSLAPKRKQLHRYLSIPTTDLEKRVAKLGDGLYLIGLYNHIGFVVVKGKKVRFVHSSVTTGGVVDERLATAAAVRASRRSGYFVTPLFQDRRLIEHWLRGRAVPFQQLGYR